MFKQAGLVYLVARAGSALGNLLALAIFSRLIGPAEYGHYLLIFSWAIIIYGFGAQWMRYAYFGVYQSPRISEYAASFAGLLATALIAIAAGFAVIAWSGLIAPLFLAAVLALICGMAVYEALFEVARTRLRANLAALSMMLRSVLVISLGSLVLWLGGGTTGLAFAIASAHVVASLPCWFAISSSAWTQGTRGASLHLLKYGWPLSLSFGASIGGQTIDRLLLERLAGTDVLGPYGAVGDVLRQTFIVFVEAILLSLITVAKQHANDGDRDKSNRVLQKAFNACVATAALGVAFFIVFGEPVLRFLLDPSFIAPSRHLVPIFAVAFAFMIMRSYFAQVIYFTDSSRLDLVVSTFQLIVSTTCSVLLIPRYGSVGAAVSLMIGWTMSCIAFAWFGRRRYRLPIDWHGAGIVLVAALLFVLGADLVARLGFSDRLLLVIDGALFLLSGGYCVTRLGLLLPAPDKDPVPRFSQAV